jgi:hypothetical protein
VNQHDTKTKCNHSRRECLSKQVFRSLMDLTIKHTRDYCFSNEDDCIAELNGSRCSVNEVAIDFQMSFTSIVSKRTKQIIELVSSKGKNSVCPEDIIFPDNQNGCVKYKVDCEYNADHPYCDGRRGLEDTYSVM